MSADRRTVSTDALETLGTAPLDGHQKRDAIHLAVIPAVATHLLAPGADVRITPAGTAIGDLRENSIGIVDPFLTAPVKPFERFWVVIYPRVITSLRHVWTHPQLPDEPATDPGVVYALGAAVVGPSKADSERWLREFCEHGDYPDFDTLMRLVRGERFDDGFGYPLEAENDGCSFKIVGRTASGDIPPEFWVHAENYLGIKLAARPTYFSCSC